MKITLNLFLVFVIAGCTVSAVSAQIYTPQGRLGGRTDGTGKFRGISGIAVDAVGNLYVADRNCVQKFTTTGRFVTKFGGPGNGNGQFTATGGIALDATGNIFVSDTGTHRIQKFDRNGTFLSSFGMPGSGKGQLQSPGALAVDRRGNLYVVDGRNYRVQKFDGSGRFLGTFGNGGDRVLRYGRYVVGDGQSARPAGIGVDASGNIYVTDAGDRKGGGCIQQFSNDGKFLRRFGNLDDAETLAVGMDGKIYVADTLGARVQVFSPQGALVSKFSAPERVTVGATGIAVDRKHDVFLAIDGNRIAYVKKFRRRYLMP